MILGRNRESRRREAAGRRNSPEAVPRKMSGRKSSDLRDSVISARGGERTTGASPSHAIVFARLTSLRRTSAEGLDMSKRRERP
jgi:hypothetical protein